MTAPFRDPDHERVLELMTFGYSQWDASRYVFAGEPLPAPTGPSGWREWVRASLQALFPDLRLEAGRVDGAVLWACSILALFFWFLLAMAGRWS
jgi:hypothetical protein